MRNYSFLLLRKRIIINKSGNNYFIHKEDLYSSISMESCPSVQDSDAYGSLYSFRDVITDI